MAVTALAAVAGAVIIVTRPVPSPASAVAGPAVQDLAGLAPRAGSPAFVPARTDPAPAVPAPAVPAPAVPTPAVPTPGPTTPGPTTPGPTTPGAATPVAPVTSGPGITLTPPRLLVVSPSEMSPRTKEDISRLEHVRKIDSFDAGAVRVRGGGLNLLAVDPARFRAWTPRAVAGHRGVWEALARGELVVAGAAARRLGLTPGARCQIEGGPALRVAASASFGLPGVDGLVGVETGRRLGLLPGVALLVHGPRKETATLGAGVRRLVGAGAQVVAVGTGRTGRASGTVGETGSETPAVGERPSAGRGTVGRPGSYLELYRRSAVVCPGLSWTVLAAIGQVESSHGRDNGPSSAGALGPMQFMPATWKAYGRDGDGDGTADIWSPYDAVPSAAGYLCANGAGQGGARLEKAVWFYNHSWSYVAKVMAIARAYAHAYP
ncbi:hypothetical protein GCM10017673_08000 [Streptosporangium violaceochromogenes]|nr:hypothetical protein GCM10017673_08000 [Streptosporangium violaceochromogenes]